jgi:hypothetical protein
MDQAKGFSVGMENTYMKLFSMVMENVQRIMGIIIGSTGGKWAYCPGPFGPLVPVAEPGSITRDQCRSRFQHEPGPRGLHVDALRREGGWAIGPGS